MTVDSIKSLRTAALIFAAAVVGFTAWLLIRPQPTPNEDPNAVKVGERSQDDVLATILQYCQTTYREELQKAAGAPIGKDAISVNNYNTVLSGDYARSSVECHTDAVGDTIEQDGFTAYMQYKGKAWSIYKRVPGPPNCKDFDNKDWPRQLAGRCYDNDLGTTRDTK